MAKHNRREYQKRIGEYLAKREDKHAEMLRRQHAERPTLSRDIVLTSRPDPHRLPRVSKSAVLFITALVFYSTLLPGADAEQIKGKRSSKKTVDDNPSPTPPPKTAALNQTTNSSETGLQPPSFNATATQTLPALINSTPAQKSSPSEDLQVEVKTTLPSPGTVISQMGLFSERAVAVEVPEAPKDMKLERESSHVEFIPIVDPWWKVLFGPRDRDILAARASSSALKDSKDMELPTIRIRGKHAAVTRIKANFEKMLAAHNYSEDIMEDLDLLSRGMPDLLFNILSYKPLITSGKFFAEYNRATRCINMIDQSPVTDSEKAYQISLLLHEITHAAHDLMDRIVRGSARNPQERDFPGDIESQKIYKKLWQMGHDRLERIVTNFNTYTQLKNLKNQTSQVKAEIQELEKFLSPYREAAVVLIDTEPFSQHDCTIKYYLDPSHPLFAGFSKLQVGDTINPEDIEGFADIAFSEDGVTMRGPLKIKRVENRDGNLYFDLDTDNPLIRLIRLHRVAQRKIALYPDTALTETGAYIRTFFPESVAKLVWKEAYEHYKDLRHKVAIALRGKNVPNNMSDIERYKISAERLGITYKQCRDKFLSDKSNSLAKDSFGSNGLAYVEVLIKSGQLDEAEKVCDEVWLNYGTNPLQIKKFVAQVFALSKRHNEALPIFEELTSDLSELGEETAMTNYLYGVSLLETGRVAQAKARLKIACKHMKEDSLIDDALMELCKRQLQRANKIAKKVLSPEVTADTPSPVH